MRISDGIVDLLTEEIFTRTGSLPSSQNGDVYRTLCTKLLRCGKLFCTSIMYPHSIGWESIRQGFADNEMASNDHLDFFALCLMDDDKTFRKNNHQSTQGFRIVLPLNFILNIMEPGDENFNLDYALKMLRMRCTPNDLNSAYVIFILVFRNKHWTVYALNRVHGQIDILDPLDWSQKDDQHRYHIPISEVMRSRLDRIFQSFTNGAFDRIFDWTFPYVKVPKQQGEHDCGFFCIHYMEHYNPFTRQMQSEIDKTKSAEFRSQLLHYFMFHRLNQDCRPFPELIEIYDPDKET